MYLNASRFEARMNDDKSIIEMEKQDRGKWNQELINKGIYYLDRAKEKNKISSYLILAAVLANHCIAGTRIQFRPGDVLSFPFNPGRII